MKFSLYLANAGAFVLAAMVLLEVGVASAAPETATPADALVDSFGVNVKLGYLDTPYGDFDKVKKV